MQPFQKSNSVQLCVSRVKEATQSVQPWSVCPLELSSIVLWQSCNGMSTGRGANNIYDGSGQVSQ